MMYCCARAKVTNWVLSKLLFDDSWLYSRAGVFESMVDVGEGRGRGHGVVEGSMLSLLKLARLNLSDSCQKLGNTSGASSALSAFGDHEVLFVN